MPVVMSLCCTINLVRNQKKKLRVCLFLHFISEKKHKKKSAALNGDLGEPLHVHFYSNRPITRHVSPVVEACRRKVQVPPPGSNGALQQEATWAERDPGMSPPACRTNCWNPLKQSWFRKIKRSFEHQLPGQKSLGYVRGGVVNGARVVPHGRKETVTRHMSENKSLQQGPQGSNSLQLTEIER